MKPKTSPQIEDVTDQFEDVNFYDRIYKTPHSYLVKVRVENVTKSTVINLRITGSWADDTTGKARRDAIGEPFIVPPDELCFQPESMPTEQELEEEIEAARKRMVARVDLIATNHYALTALSGVKNAPKVVQ